MNTTSVKRSSLKEILSDPGKNPAHFFFSISNTPYLSSIVNEWKQMLIITIFLNITEGLGHQ